MAMKLLVLALLWCFWCGLHSLLIHDPIKSWVLRSIPLPDSCYRLFYNLLALFTVLPILAWSLHLSDAVWLLSWAGPWVLLQYVCWVAVAALAWFGSRAYSLEEFLGIHCLQQIGKPLQPVLITDGVLGVVRHPWYLAGLLVLWARNLDGAALVSALVLSGYLLLGALVEERRLGRLFGPAYAEYRRQVPMLIPWRWLMAQWRKGMPR